MVFGLLVASMFPTGIMADNSDSPELEDRIGDAKLFGIFGFLLQFPLKHVDIVSAWFHEDGNNPDYLYVSLELRDLKEKTGTLEAIYVVGWSNDNHHFLTGLSVFPGGAGGRHVGVSMDEDDVIDEYIVCDGTYDSENNIITWEVPKDVVGNPQPGDVLKDINPNTHLRYPYGYGLHRIDLFKDLSGNAKTTKDYTVQY